MTKIKDALIEFNPWWKGPYTIQYKERVVYKEIVGYLQRPQIIALTGLRRVGKTTLMHKIIADEIQNGRDPRKILYFSFDEFKDIGPRDVFKVYEELTEEQSKETSLLVLFDEIQKVVDWENKIKTTYDLFGKQVKIIISGSESLFIKKKSKETLAGRIFIFKIGQLSFKEFLHFRNVSYKPISLYKKELSQLFREFIRTEGFPELVEVTENEVITKYIKESIIDRVLFRDIPSISKIKDITILESLFNIFLEEPGQLTDLNSLAQDLGVSRQTIAQYLFYLEESFLLKKLYNFSKSKRKSERKLKKYYPALLSPSLLLKDDEFSQSKVFEWFLVTQSNAVFFWRDPFKNEVDIVLVHEKEPIPLEVKYGKVDYRGIQAFMKKFSISTGYIISKEKEHVENIDGKKIIVIPAFLYLLQ
jgi:predicted AAA+ superfamily ATPase